MLDCLAQACFVELDKEAVVKHVKALYKSLLVEKIWGEERTDVYLQVCAVANQVGTHTSCIIKSIVFIK